MMAMMVSCGPSPKSIKEKIDNKEELTMQDYEAMQEYIMDALNEQVKLVEDCDGDRDKLEEKGKELDEKYEYYSAFQDALWYAKRDKAIDKETYNKWKKEQDAAIEKRNKGLKKYQKDVDGAVQDAIDQAESMIENADWGEDY